MSSAAGYVLLLSSKRKVLFDENTEDGRFAEAVPEFEHSRNVPLVCFVFSPERILTHICAGARGQLAATHLRRLNLTEFHVVEPTITDERIVDYVKNRKLEERLANGGLLSPGAFEAIVEAVSVLSPSSASVLARFRSSRLKRIARLSESARSALANQKEALLTAMAIARVDKKEVSKWDFADAQAPRSFLEGLPSVRLREDQMIFNDLSILPGFEQIDSLIQCSTVFESDESRLTVLLANRLPLEEQTGADLIYYNETFKCFLLIQYKAMNHEGAEAIFRFPDDQLKEEIQRMDDVLQTLSMIESVEDADGFRLNTNPFFLKICPRIVFNPDNVGLSIGMYLPLDYWKVLAEHPELTGPRGGKYLSYQNVRRYFSNSEFVTIASRGWIGTTIAQSILLKDVIRNTVASGRAAVVAINRDVGDRHRPSGTVNE